MTIDTRYGTGQTYGTAEATYGFHAITSILAWGVEVDWDGDGVFDGSNEAPYMTSISVSRGRKRQLKSTGYGFESISVGKLTMEFVNNDGRYDGWNTSSPLYPNVTYGRDVRVKVLDWATGNIEPVFYGVISDIVRPG